MQGLKARTQEGKDKEGKGEGMTKEMAQCERERRAGWRTEV